MGPLVVYFEGEEESDLTKKSRAFSTKIRGKKLQKNTCMSQNKNIVAKNNCLLVFYTHHLQPSSHSRTRNPRFEQC